MNHKFYQVVDSIHGTIYYTYLEKIIISTPFFNRLHDVNQSSTVYLTFPPNRTKRYEHSLGTMQLTSDVFYNASVNSVVSKELDLLMEKTSSEFEKIFSYVKKGKSKFIFSFDQKTLSIMDRIKQKSEKDIIEIINRHFFESYKENCLLNFVPRSLHDGYSAFMYTCLLQALRIVGLLHDIGHPPQSHIIESVLTEIYDEIQSRDEVNKTKRQKNFVNIISSYKNIEDDSIVLIDKQMAIKTKNRKPEHLHEMIGVQIIKYIIEGVFPELIEKSIGKNERENILNVFYYFTIIEFIFAIIRNKNTFWSDLHSIIDGTIDTDRLDFVPRDSENSGMLWGKVAYKRLINTVKFGVVKDQIGQTRICV